ncbi:MAG: hypothetical protein ACK40E_06360 [Caldimicrobium sp.]
MNVIKLITIIGFALLLFTTLTSAKNPNSTLPEFKNVKAMPINLFIRTDVAEWTPQKFKILRDTI